MLLLVAFARELLGTGRVFGVSILPTEGRRGAGTSPNGLMVLAPAAFILIGCFIWAVRSFKTEQVEEEFSVGTLSRASRRKPIFVENLALAFFLGMCSFLAISRRVETALGMGLAVIFVLGDHGAR